jgi:hypothetical protein
MFSMAERKSGGASGGMGILTNAAATMASIFTWAYQAVMRDGHVAAVTRQGADELGQALKAFPDSVQQPHEPGTLWNPTQGEVAADRSQSRQFRSTYGSSAARSNDHSPGRGEIARDDRPYVPPDRQQGQEPSHGPEV